jgi:hypothetical protein
MMAKIYVLHENDAWVEPLRRAFAGQGLPFEEWFLDEGRVDFGTSPPEGVFYNRMSASSYTRDHRHGPELAALVLDWLEGHGRRVVNRGRALALEVSKAAQSRALEAAGIRTPRTAAAVGRRALLEAADAFAGGPLILKPNRGGKGHGVRLFQSPAALKEHVAGATFEPSVDGVYVLQEYIRSPEPFITRAEFIGGRFFYALRVDTSQGFELCPADDCQAGDAFCPVGESAKPRFAVVDAVDPGLLRRYERFLAANGIEVAGIEFVADAEGRPYTYDVNTNTNYNPEAEARAGRFGMEELARFLGRELRALARDAERMRLTA